MSHTDPGDDAGQRHRPRPGNVVRPDISEVAAASQAGVIAKAGPTQEEVAHARTRLRRRRRVWGGAALAVVLLAASVIVLTIVGGPLARTLLPWADPQGSNPFGSRAFYVAEDTPAATAAQDARARGADADADVLERLASVPTAVWLTPEQFTPDALTGTLEPVVEQVRERDEVGVFVVYGIPERDCGAGQSAGGLPAEEYVSWVGAIASVLSRADERAVAILEPDALAATADCPDLADRRVDLLAGALGALVDAGVPTYVDAGHSDWRSVDDMAALLERVGVDRARGFSTNVSAYQPDADEIAYAEELSSALDDAHYVIDTGRNGGPDRPGSLWCNPSPAGAFGQEPAAVDDGSGLDARLWIKPPGESDGDGAECSQGPAAGVFWTERALEMASASGWR